MDNAAPQAEHCGMSHRAVPLFLIACLIAGPLRAETDSFVGQWKLVKLTDQMDVTKVGANKYTFDFGGGPETIVVDGTFQPGYTGTTLSVTADGPKWKVVRKQGAHTLLSAIWTLSADGNALNDDFTAYGRDGSQSNVNYVYERKAAGSGFAGTWVSATAAITSPLMLKVRPYQSNGLTFITPSTAFNVNLDGKDHPGASAGSTMSARRVNARTLEITRRAGGKIDQTRQMELSSDLKTLTMTVHIAGKDQPYVYVFERA